MKTFKYSCEFIGDNDNKEVVEFEAPIEFSIIGIQSYTGKKLSLTEYLDDVNNSKLDELYQKLPLNALDLSFYIYLDNEKKFLYNFSSINELTCETKINTSILVNEDMINFWGKKYNFYSVLEIK